MMTGTRADSEPRTRLSKSVLIETRPPMELMETEVMEIVSMVNKRTSTTGTATTIGRTDMKTINTKPRQTDTTVAAASTAEMKIGIVSTADKTIDTTIETDTTNKIDTIGKIDTRDKKDTPRMPIEAESQAIRGKRGMSQADTREETTREEMPTEAIEWTELTDQERIGLPTTRKHTTTTRRGLAGMASKASGREESRTNKISTSSTTTCSPCSTTDYKFISLLIEY